MDTNVTEVIKGVPNILGMLYTDLAQPSVKAVGDALGTVFEFSTSILLPLKLCNEKFKVNFTKRLNEYKDKLEGIPEEKRCKVHPQIGTPIIEKLSYTTSDEIADMFTTLLANASNIETVNAAHPAFVSMIERMSPDEEMILKYLKGKEDIQYCDINGFSNINSGYNTLFDHVTMLEDDVQLMYPQNINAYLANFVSLGILIDEKGTFRMDKTEYNRITAKYNVENLRKELVPNVLKSIQVEESYYDVTTFGKLFIQACIR